LPAELRIFLIEREQLIVCSALCDSAVIEHENLVCVRDLS
jgi:hypothetical protein